MKKLIILILVLPFFSFAKDSTRVKYPVRAQFYMNITPAFSNSDIRFKKDKLSSNGGGSVNGNFTIGMQLPLNDTSSITTGLSFGTTGYQTGDRYYLVKGPEQTYHFNVVCLQFLVNIRIHYFKTKNRSFYSGFAGGIQYNKVSAVKAEGFVGEIPEFEGKVTEAIADAVFLGYYRCFGKKGNIGLKGEIGFGANGILRVGGLYRFSH